MNTGNTIKAIKQIIIPCFDTVKKLKPNASFECEFDNAPEHRSKKTQQFVHSKQCRPHVKLDGHPINERGGRLPNSPDLCSIEHVFSMWEEKVYIRNPKTIVELRNCCEEEWKKIPQSFIQSCYTHMTNVYP